MTANAAPSAVTDAVTTDEDQPVSVDVLANDSDAEGDSISVTGVQDGASGTAELDPAGTVTYIPDPDFNGTDEFLYSVVDGAGNVSQGRVVVEVSPVNDDPVASDDVLAAVEDVPLDLNVLDNDVDVDGDTLQVQSFTQPTMGVVTPGPDGTLTYTPDPESCGVDVFQYVVTDGNGTADGATVQVNVMCVNDPPVALDDVIGALSGTPVIIDALANDFDIEGGDLEIVSITVPMHGAATIDAGGTITYTSEPTYVGPDSIVYTVSDPDGATAMATVDIQVTDTAQVNLTYTGVPTATSFEGVTGVATVTVPLEVEEDPADIGFPNGIQALATAIEHDPMVLQPTGVSEGAALLALGGAELFMPTITPGAVVVAVTVSSTGGPLLQAEGPQEMVTIDYQGNAGFLTGQPFPLQTMLEWTPGFLNQAIVSGSPVVPTLVDAPVDLEPLPLDAGFHFLSPGLEVPYDPSTGIGGATHGLFIQEGEPAPGTAFGAFSLAIRHDPTLVDATGITPGADLAALGGGTGPDSFLPVVFDGLVTVNAIFDFTGTESLMADLPLEVVTIEYETVSATLLGNGIGLTTPLDWEVGNPSAPNHVLVGGQEVIPALVGGVIHLVPGP